MSPNFLILPCNTTESENQDWEKPNNEATGSCSWGSALSVGRNAGACLWRPYRWKLVPSIDAIARRAVGNVDDICEPGSQDFLALLSQTARSRTRRTDGLTTRIGRAPSFRKVKTS